MDRNRRNVDLLEHLLAQQGYRMLTADSLEGCAEVLAGEQDVDLALVDIAGFDARVWEYCERLRERHIPFLVPSPRQAVALKREGAAHGAQAVLVKPLVGRELLLLIDRLLERGQR